MKFMMNGAITIGTLDGANIEIMQAAGRENIYIFGLTAEEVEKGYSSYRASEVYETNPAIRRGDGAAHRRYAVPRKPRLFQDLYHALLFGDGGGMADPYFVLKDLPGYVRTQAQVGADYQNRERWLARAIMNTASSGYFASDRTIEDTTKRCGICPNCLYRSEYAVSQFPRFAIPRAAGRHAQRRCGHAPRALQHSGRARIAAHLVGGKLHRV